MSTEIKVPFTRPSINEEEEKAVLEVIRSGWLTTGKVTLAFEKEFSDFMNSGLKEKNVMSLAVNSNTSGMILAMHACGVKPGTAVITTPYTFVSTAACAKHLGADVIFCDIEKDSYNIDGNLLTAHALFVYQLPIRTKSKTSTFSEIPNSLEAANLTVS